MLEAYTTLGFLARTTRRMNMPDAHVLARLDTMGRDVLPAVAELVAA
jgi:hypothetical protein